ncbi:EpsG family protein [Flavobacterium psychrophilum]|uniref:EpsG family protein n=1 Tax=Flavobacterium psychrophilum TaxID=96345 RepID=UPI000A38AF00|nr:EpsG family protein [Flavobacterium psychrophilum]
MVAFIFIVLLSISSLYFKKSKTLFVLFFLSMWGLFGWNYSNADFHMYKGMYSVPLSEMIFFKFEGGYNILMYGFKSLGLNFRQFYIAVSGAVLLLVFRFFYQFSNFSALLAVCFFWFLFPLQYVIFRNFIAFSIILQGFLAVLKNEKYYKAKYVFFVLIAATIHISSLLYLLFLLAFKENEIKIKTVLLWVIGLLVVVMVFHDLIFVVCSFYSKCKAMFYATSLRLFLFYSSIQLANLYVVGYFLKPKNAIANDEDSRLNTIIININIVMLLLIVVYYEMAVFVRILLSMTILNIVFITNKLFLTDGKKRPKVLFLGYLFFWFFCFIFLVREKTLFSLFKHNLLFK